MSAKSSAKLIECVPNFSEGKNAKIINAIADAIKCTPGCALLDVDAGPSTNRTVYTFVGSPEAVIEGALAAAKVAFDLIDMRAHFGEHKRLGALDVCPFIPVGGCEMEEAIYCARKFGARLAQSLQVPVYLYGYASVEAHRKSVPQIRAGEYEGLREKLTAHEWKPDFGPATFVPTWGASIVGARKFLIAYNVNLYATKEQAHKIALNVRESGRGEDAPGRCKALQASGFWLAEHRLAQVSMNLTDLDVTPLHVAYEEVASDAAAMNLPLVGSQVVGLLPLNELLKAADYYIERDGLLVLEEEQKVHLVISKLGLHSSVTGFFDPSDKIIEYRLRASEEPANLLINLSLRDFVKSVGDRTTAPGGGSVSAALGALGAALASMVAKLSYGKKACEDREAEMRALIPALHQSMDALLAFVDADTDAYKDYVGALKLPAGSQEECAVREAAIEAGIKNAISVPLKLASAITQLWPSAIKLASIINISSASDLEVGVTCMRAAVQGAYFNVRTNLKDVKESSAADKKYVDATLLAINKCMESANSSAEQTLAILNSRIASSAS